MATETYFVKVFPGNPTNATADDAIIQIWNPSSTRILRLIELIFSSRFGGPATGAAFVARRSTARGTATSSVVPTAEHHKKRKAAPASAFEIDLPTFSPQPTLAGGDLTPNWTPGEIRGSCVIVPIPRAIEIPPGTGLAFVNVAAIQTVRADWGLVIEEL